MSQGLEIPEFTKRAFSINFEHEVQQRMSKLKDLVTVDAFTGKEKIYNDFDSVEFTEKTTRLGNTNADEVTGSKRKMSKRDFECAKIFDRTDREYLAELGLPTGETIQAMGFAWQRKVDSLIIEAATGTVYGGAEPYVTPITLGSGQSVAVDYVKSGSTANSGLTPHKLEAAMQIYKENEIFPEEEEIFLVMGPQQESDLFTAIESAGNDVWASMMANFRDGKTDTLFGFKTRISNRLSLDSSTDIRTVITYSKRGIYVSPDKLETKIDVLPEKGHAIQVAAYGNYGAIRRKEERVVKILCDESP